MHNNRLKPVRIPLSAVEWFDLKFNRSLNMHGIVCAKGAKFFESANKNLVLLFGLQPAAFLISNRFQYVISQQMKENKFLIKFLIYYFFVQLLFVHTVISLRYDNKQDIT